MVRGSDVINTESDAKMRTNLTQSSRNREAKATSKLSAIGRIVSSRRALSRCIPTAAVVGTLLSLINQGSVILAGDATTATWIRVLFNYLIPFTVSNIGFVSAVLAARRHDATSNVEPSDQ